MRDDVRATLDRILNAPVFTLGQTAVTVVTLLVFAVLVVLTIWLSGLAQRGVRRGLLARGNTDEGTAAVIGRLVSYAIIAMGFAMALSTMGVNLGALFAAGAFFALALGFAMQNVAENFVAGLILLTERTIKPGDVLEVEGNIVRVTHMGLRATVARSRDDEDLIIPNSKLVQNTVTNYTLRDPLYRLRTLVGVSYDSDIAVVRDTLYAAARDLGGRDLERDPVVLLKEFADSSVVFEVQLWTRDAWGSRRAQSTLNEAIWYGFKRVGVSIPYPQVDLHVRSGLPAPQNGA